MRLVLDEMHAPAVATALVAGGRDVVAVAAAPRLRGLADEELLGWAATEDRALVTENIADFASLATMWATDNREHGGLVLTNPRRFNRAALAYPGDLIAALRTFLERPPVAGRSWTWWL